MIDLSHATDKELLDELNRRLRGRQKAGKPAARIPPEALPDANATRTMMTRQLQEGKARGQTVEILNFLVKSGTPRTMPEIAAHMRSLGYSASRYYDASNALVAAGLCERHYVGRDKSWLATDTGKAFLQRITVVS